MNKEKDKADFDKLIHRLETEGKEMTGKDVLLDIIAPEKYPFATRMIVREIVDIVWDKFVDMIPENLKHFFSGYIFPKKEFLMSKSEKC